MSIFAGLFIQSSCSLSPSLGLSAIYSGRPRWGEHGQLQQPAEAMSRGQTAQQGQTGHGRELWFGRGQVKLLGKFGPENHLLQTLDLES